MFCDIGAAAMTGCSVVTGADFFSIFSFGFASEAVSVGAAVGVGEGCADGAGDGVGVDGDEVEFGAVV